MNAKSYQNPNRTAYSGTNSYKDYKGRKCSYTRPPDRNSHKNSFRLIYLHRGLHNAVSMPQPACEQEHLSHSHLLNLRLLFHAFNHHDTDCCFRTFGVILIFAYKLSPLPLSAAMAYHDACIPVAMLFLNQHHHSLESPRF